MTSRRVLSTSVRRYLLLGVAAVVASQLGAIVLAFNPPTPNWWIATGTAFPEVPAIVHGRALSAGWNEDATDIGLTASASRIGFHRVWMPGLVSEDRWIERVNGGLISELDWIAAGFPFHSAIDARLILHVPDRYMNPTPVPWTDDTTRVQLCGLGEPQEDGLRIPIRPMMAGALANVVVYMLTFELTRLVWRRLRRRHRVNRGRCAACGYLTRGVETCSECGSACESKAREVQA